jgi:hypothetical protein
MQRVKMLRTMRGSYDGFTPFVWLEGHEYDLTDDLLRSMIAEGAVELVLPVLETKPEPVKRGRRV